MRDATNGGGVWLDTGSVLNSNGGNIVVGGGAFPFTNLCGEGPKCQHDWQGIRNMVLTYHCAEKNITQEAEAASTMQREVAARRQATGLTSRGAAFPESDGTVTIDGISGGERMNAQPRGQASARQLQRA